MVSSGICALSPVIHCLSSSCLGICSVWTFSSCSGGRTWAHFLPCCLVCAPSPTWTLTWEAQHLGLRAETEWTTVTSVTRDGAHCSLLRVYMKDQLTRWREKELRRKTKNKGLALIQMKRAGHKIVWATEILYGYQSFQNHCGWWLQPWVKRHFLEGKLW